MLTKVFIPEWLYRVWPWLTISMGAAFGLLGHTFVFLALLTYSSLVIIHRAISHLNT